MRKQGPCYHCGAKETPLWRNGPKEKPVLCNACGSRWRIRGTLENYIPKRGHASRCRRSRKMKDVIIHLDSERITTMARTGDARGGVKRGSWRGFGGNPNRASDESEIWTTNGSSSELVMSDPRSLFDVAIKSESEDPDEGITYSGKRPAEQPWEADVDEVPDVTDEVAHIKMLQRELLDLYEQHKSSMVEEEELLYDVVNPFMDENEIGFGSFLLKPSPPPPTTTPLSMEQAVALIKDQPAQEKTPPAQVSSSTVDKLQTPSKVLTDPADTLQFVQFPDQEIRHDDESIAEIFFPRAPFASDGTDS